VQAIRRRSAVIKHLSCINVGDGTLPADSFMLDISGANTTSGSAALAIEQHPKFASRNIALSQLMHHERATSASFCLARALDRSYSEISSGTGGEIRSCEGSIARTVAE
jgi:hypothetical protein